MRSRGMPQQEESKSRELSRQKITHYIAFFSIFASRGIIASFFPLCLKQIGLNAQQIGTIMFFRPLGGMIGAVLCPYVTLIVKDEIHGMALSTCFFLTFFFVIPWTIPVSPASVCSTLIQTVHSNASNPEWLIVENLTSIPDSSQHITTHTNRAWLYSKDSLWLIMVMCAVLTFCADVCSMSANSLQHGITLKYLGKENTKQYGLIRAWGALGHAAAAGGTGLVVWKTVTVEKICTHLLAMADYHYIFYIFLGLCMITIVNAGNIPEGSEEGQISSSFEKMMNRTDFIGALTTKKNLCWLFVLLSRSIFYAVTQGFLNWHMENLGASPGLIGASNFVTTATEFLMFFTTPKLIEIFGHKHLVSAGILSYVCRFFIFAVISNPVLVLPVEVMEGVMFACIWSSIVSYLSNQVPEEGQTQVQGVIQALYMLGTAIGFPISGVLTQIFGAPIMFLTFAALASITFVTFITFQFIITVADREPGGDI